MLDRLRDLYPHLGLAVYAYEPGKPVTVEVLTPDGGRFQKTATTMNEALAGLFGPLPDDEEVQHEQPPQEQPEEDDADDIFS